MIVKRQIGDWSEAQVCRCRRIASAKRLLAKIPPIFGKPKLSRLKPRLDLHPMQGKLIAKVQANPDDSYLLTGKNGTGKSHVAWALYRRAIAQRRGVVACTVRDLLEDFRRAEVGRREGEVFRPRVTADQLRRAEGSQRLLVLLDEFEKARPSEFASEMLFSVLDAIKSFKHQLVVTSNMNLAELRNHWGRIDEIWGNSIVTRLADCTVVEMF